MEIYHMNQREPYVSPDSSSPHDSSTRSPSPAPKTKSDDGTAKPEIDSVSEEPPEHIKNKLHFIINNVSKANLRRKRKNLKAILKPEFYVYFANYLVMHRASKEPNCHEVYTQLLEVSGLTKFRKQLLDSTYEYIKTLLSDHSQSPSVIKNMLRNLGIWLGLLTVARDKPVLTKKLALKELILEGFHSRRLQLVLPFATKVLEQCVHSKIFRPPNPWLMAMLSLLREIFEIPGLPTHLQVFIEVLFDKIALKIADIRPTGLLKNGTYVGKERSEHRPIIPPGLLANPTAKSQVVLAIEKAVSEVSNNLYQRALFPACRTTQELVLKDFAQEPDDAKILKAGHQMARSLASSLVLVHCQDAMRQSMYTQLSNLLEGADPAQLEQMRSRIAADNLEWTCAVVEKNVMEKAVVEMNNILTPLLLARKRNEKWYEVSSFVNSLPENLRPSPGGLSPQQLGVYDEFSRYPLIRKDDDPAPELSPHSPQKSAHQDTLDNLSKCQKLLEELVLRYPRHATTSLVSIRAESSKQDRDFAQQFRMVSVYLDRHPDDVRETLSLTFARQVFLRLFETECQQSLALVDLQVHLLKCIKAVCPVVTKQLSNLLIEADDSVKLSLKNTVNLLKADLLSIPDLETHFVKILKSVDDTSHQVLEYITNLLYHVISEQPILRVFDFPQLFEALSKLKKKVGLEVLASLLEKFSKGPTEDNTPLRAAPQDATNPESDVIMFLFERWIEVRETATDKAYADFLEVLQQHRVLSTPEKTVDFFLWLTNQCVSSYGHESNEDHGVVDALATLVVFLVKFFSPTWDEPNPNDPNASKLQLLKAFLYAACRLVRRDFELCSKTMDTKTRFNPRPYLLLFTKLLQYLNTPDPNLDSNNIDVLLAFGHCFRLLRPARVPSFAFAWLELISHRMYMPKLLIAKAPACLNMFERLLVDLFEFLQPYLRNVELNDSIRVLYKGTLRILLVLVRDFPEFLGEYHFSFCNVIPPTCVQIRNIILAAFPRDMELPNPFTPNLKVDLSQITQPPYVASDITAQLTAHKLLTPLISFLSKRSPASFLQSLVPPLTFKDPKETKRAGTVYNVPFLNSLVLFVGLQGIIKLQNTTSVTPMLVDNACMDVFECLVQNLDMEGRYYFLNAIANQLRYPNNHTHYFSCLFLVLFTTQSSLREQITRVLFERVVCHPPHPWGLLITFIELIRNTRYAFWDQPFIKCHPEIERLFESVARICVPVKPANSPTPSGSTGSSDSASMFSTSPIGGTGGIGQGGSLAGRSSIGRQDKRQA